MATVRFKDLCIDARDPERVGRFWADVLGLEARVHHRPGVVGVWRGDVPVIWVNQVDRAKTVKNRVHLDLWVRSPEALVERGATVLAEHDGWTVLADPEGNELCAFPEPEPKPGAEAAAPKAAGDPAPPARLLALCVDSDRPEELARWWADRTGAEVGPGPDGTPRWLHGVGGLDGALWKFVPVADERVGENRIHWDLLTDVEPLVAAGASVIREPDGDIDWTVLRDPQQNVFCAFAPR